MILYVDMSLKLGIYTRHWSTLDVFKVPVMGESTQRFRPVQCDCITEGDFISAIKIRLETFRFGVRFAARTSRFDAKSFFGKDLTFELMIDSM